jgi:hypothetical protein
MGRSKRLTPDFLRSTKIKVVAKARYSRKTCMDKGVYKSKVLPNGVKQVFGKQAWAVAFVSELCADGTIVT